MIMRFARGKAKFGHVFQTPGEQVFKPVSYTHLDVYKRQGYTPAAPCSAEKPAPEAARGRRLLVAQLRDLALHAQLPSVQAELALSLIHI